jgi:hypothetical protein
MANLDKDKIEFQNVGKPVNSSENDFSFIANDVTKMGYFSSNRVGDRERRYLPEETTVEKAVLK